MSAPAFSAAVVIPVYNHGHAIGRMVDGVRAQDLPCILVDDGSEPGCAAVLDTLAAQHPGAVTLVRLSPNQGKGAAVLEGLRTAARLGHSHAVQIDADGQHRAEDLRGFIEEAREYPTAVISGCPVYDASVPKGRLYGRYLTHVWVWINTLSLQIRDSMCGFRVYPLPPVLALAEVEFIGKRMDFDPEVLVRLFWRGVPVRNRPTRVIYPDDGVSHFDVWRDNVRISKMHTRLFFGMLRRQPRQLAQRLRPA
jgi:glycosyltransferase involved in cell wall biosynthesis